MASSTAVRFRSRLSTEYNPAYDQIVNQAENDEVVLETLASADLSLSSHVSALPGDRLSSFADFVEFKMVRGRVLADSIAVSDSLVRENSYRKIFTDGFPRAYDAFDAQYERFRAFASQLNLSDSFIQQIEREGGFVIVNKELLDSVGVNDSIILETGGARVRVLVDSLTSADSALLYYSRSESLADNINAEDSSDFNVVRNRALAESVVVTDDVLVGRDAIISIRSLFDNLSTVDTFSGTLIPGSGAGGVGRIIHGIEVQ